MAPPMPPPQAQNMYPSAPVDQPPQGMPGMDGKMTNPNAGVQEGTPVMFPPADPNMGGGNQPPVDDFQARLDALKNL